MTFEVDENSILVVTAVERGTGKEEVMSIQSDAGHLSAEEIARMVREAEEFAEEDRLVKEKIDAKHALQNYIYSMRNTIEDRDKLADKIETADKSTIAEALTDAEDWLNMNDDADKEEYYEKMKDLQGVCDPIIAEIYQRQGH